MVKNNFSIFFRFWKNDENDEGHGHNENHHHHDDSSATEVIKELSNDELEDLKLEEEFDLPDSMMRNMLELLESGDITKVYIFI